MAIKTLNSLQHIRVTISAAERATAEHASDETLPPIAQGSFLDDQQAVLKSLEREVCKLCSSSVILSVWC